MRWETEFGHFIPFEWKDLCFFEEESDRDDAGVAEHEEEEDKNSVP